MKVQLDKSEFLHKEVAFLGHIVTREGVKPNPEKMEIIRKWPLPKNEKELRGFLGILGYYRKFIRDFAKIAKPLTKTLRKGEAITHTKDFVDAFERCRNILTSSDILQYPNFDKPFILTTDASNFAVGAVLSQGQIGSDKPIAFASRTLNKSEENYSAIEKELLAIVWACKYFRPYLYGRKFTLYTDHKPLTYSLNLKNSNSRLIHWRLYLEEFDYEIKYRPGKQNIVADSLSRVREEINLNEAEENSSSTSESDTSSDGATAHSADTDDSDFIPGTEKPLNEFCNQIVLKIGPNEEETYEEIFPRVFRRKITKLIFGVPYLIKMFKNYIDPKRSNCILCPEKLIQTIQIVYKNYFSRGKPFKIYFSQKILIDLKTAEEQNIVIEQTHENGHRGVWENNRQIANRYYFPAMKRKIRQFVRLCRICNKNKYERHPYKIMLGPTPDPKKPLDLIHLDIFLKQPNIFLSFLDKFSRYATLIPIKSRNIQDMLRSQLLKLITLTFITTSSSRTIQIHDLTRNPGLVTLQTGNVLIKTGRHRIYHTIDLEDYRPLLNNIAITIDGLKIFTDFSDVYITLQSKFKKAQNTYMKLLPNRRNKRGAFNFLGSAIKAITGNLDEEDRIQIDNDINDLKRGNQELIRQNNIQVTINKHLGKRINKLIDSVNEQQRIIKQQIISARQSLITNKLVNQNFTAIRQAFKISYHVDLIQEHLDSIFEVIQLAKINIISKNFLEAEELKFISDKLEEQNITIQHPDQAYDYLDIRALFKESILYFIIGVPQILPHPFTSLLLEPLPINGQIIKLPWHKAAIYGNSTYFIKGSCQSIGENSICEEDKLDDTSDDRCFSKIIRGSPGKCTFTNYRNTTNIKRLTDNHIIIIITTVTLSSDCLHNNRVLTGTMLLFFENCTISLNNKTFSSITFPSRIIPTIVPLDGVKIEQNEFEQNLDFHTLKKLHFQNREQLEIIKTRYFIQTSTSLGLSSICFIIGLIVIVYHWYQKKRTPNEEKPNISSADNHHPNTIVSGRSKLDEGVVNASNIIFPTATEPITVEQLIGSINSQTQAKQQFRTPT
ncbi:uncharacterized protein LOC129777879 [Toxorhynchites rutilus septentrionalis]|uniref:uncharacterized protein LOC129777879 n=1 Tax=Toxorhynchites rutilus septentrionalis TaxID=329112 RepID=UPI002478C4D0|nr:uncharacterized protein LOC129777879 [Toxorhynchites rutilus septentrionalis]